MKKFIFVMALISFSYAAVAQSVFVRNYGSTFQVEIWNRMPRQIFCSGPVYVRYMDGQMFPFQVATPVRPQGSFVRTYMPPTPKPINFITHNIWCR